MTGESILPTAVTKAAKKISTDSEFLSGVEADWPFLAIAAQMDKVFGQRSRSSRAKPYKSGIEYLQGFIEWLDKDGSDGRVTLMLAYSMGHTDGLIEGAADPALIDRDIEGLKRALVMLRHFSGVDDKKRRKKVFLPALAAMVWNARRRLGLSDPERSLLSPDVALMGEIAKALGVRLTADAHLKALVEAGQ